MAYSVVRATLKRLVAASCDGSDPCGAKKDRIRTQQSVRDRIRLGGNVAAIIFYLAVDPQAMSPGFWSSCGTTVAERN